MNDIANRITDEVKFIEDAIPTAPMTKDLVVELLTKRAQIMSWIEAYPEDETVSCVLAELDTRLALHKATTKEGQP